MVQRLLDRVRLVRVLAIRTLVVRVPVGQARFVLVRPARVLGVRFVTVRRVMDRVQCKDLRAE